MGTSGAYGGSTAGAWNDVREAWGGLDGSSGDSGDGPPPMPGDGGESTEAPAAFDPLGSAIAQALIAGDPAARAPSLPFISLPSLLPRRAGSGGGGVGGGGGGTTGTSGASGSSGGRSRRQVIQQAARGGAAVGAATAYRDRDAATLADYGITLDELDRLTPRNRCARLLDLVLGEAGHPDEAAVRKAAAQQVKKILNEATPPNALESVRDFIGEMTLQLGLVELRDQILANRTTAQDATRKERGLRQWIAAKIRALDLARYGAVTAVQCHAVAAAMAHDALRLLAAR